MMYIVSNEWAGWRPEIQRNLQDPSMQVILEKMQKGQAAA